MNNNLQVLQNQLTNAMQGRIQRDSATQISLQRYTGDTVEVNGLNVSIGSSGLSRLTTDNLITVPSGEGESPQLKLKPSGGPKGRHQEEPLPKSQASPLPLGAPKYGRLQPTPVRAEATAFRRWWVHFDGSRLRRIDGGFDALLRLSLQRECLAVSDSDPGLSHGTHGTERGSISGDFRQ
jgi:hypothetical protein